MHRLVDRSGLHTLQSSGYCQSVNFYADHVLRANQFQGVELVNENIRAISRLRLVTRGTSTRNTLIRHTFIIRFRKWEVFLRSIYR